MLLNLDIADMVTAILILISFVEVPSLLTGAQDILKSLPHQVSDRSS